MTVLDEMVQPETVAFAKEVGIDLENLRYPGFDRPTQTSVLKYLRETCGYLISPVHARGGKWDAAYTVYTPHNYYVLKTIQGILSHVGDIRGCRKQYKTMEEAFEGGIRKVLERIKELNEI